MTDANMGHAAQFATDAAGTAIGSFTEPFEIQSENIQKRGTILDTNGIRGTRSHASERTREGTYEVGGSMTFNPSPADLDIWLPRIMGAAEVTDVFNFAETLPEFAVAVDRVGKRFVYDDCKVNKATFRSRAGEFVELTLDIIGKTESTSATAFPSLSLGVTDADDPYVHHDGVVTLVSTARPVMDWEIEIDNALSARFTNSQTATSITPTDRIVTARFTNPYTADELDLYEQAVAGSAGTIVITNGSVSTTFTFGVLQFPDLSPVVAGKQEIPLTLEGIARMTGSTEPLVITNDAAA